MLTFTASDPLDVARRLGAALGLGQALKLCLQEIEQFHSTAYPECTGGCPAHEAMNAARAALAADSRAPVEVRPGALVRRKTAKRISGYVVRWPKDRADWKPLNDGSDEWVVCWFYTDGPQEELVCADDFDVVGYLPEGE